ncbi:MAG: vWA domain-containing protein [Phycisphaerales bacterium]
MTFLTPLYGIIAGAIAIPALLILYFLRLRRNEMEISSTLLWKKAIEDLQANAPFQRLRKNLLLFLQLVVLCAAVVALAQPQLRAAFAPGVQHVLLVDRSASMQATDGDEKDPTSKQTRLEAAKKDALKIIDGLREPGAFGAKGDQAMVVSMDVAGTVVQQFTDNKKLLRDAIERIEPADTGTAIEPAFKLAKAFLPKRTFIDTKTKSDGTEDRKLVTLDEQTVGEVTIHIFSDGQIPDVSRIRPQGGDADKQKDDTVVYHAVGSPEAWNLGIVALRAERAFDKPTEVQVFVGVQNTAHESKSVDVQLVIDGQVASVKSITLPPAIKSQDMPGGKTDEQPHWIPASGGVIFKVERPQGGVLSIQLKPETPDVLPLDDEAFLVIPPARRLAVALITPGNGFLRNILERMNLSKPVLIVPPAQGEEFLASEQRKQYDVVVMDRWAPSAASAGKEGTGFPPGKFLMFGSPAPPMGVVADGAPEPAIVLTWERNHPILRNVGMENLQIGKSPRTKVPERGLARVLASGSAGPLICEASSIESRVVFTTFDPLESNWPIDAGYVVFILSALTHLSTDAGDSGALLVQPGGQIDQRLPEGAKDVELRKPNKNESADQIVLSSDNRATAGPILSTGIYTLSWIGPAMGTDQEVNGRVRRPIASNLANAEESDISTRNVLDTASRQVVKADEAEGVQRLWPWLLLGALAVMLFEWYIYNRKVMI